MSLYLIAYSTMFLSQTTYAVGDIPLSVAVADVRNNNKSGIVITN
jgi:hypothetical protein